VFLFALTTNWVWGLCAPRLWRIFAVWNKQALLTSLLELSTRGHKTVEFAVLSLFAVTKLCT